MWNINYKKVFVLFLLSIFLFTLVKAQEVISPGDYYPNQDAYLFQTCGNCTYVNITNIILANKTNITSNIAMTKTDTFYYYWLNQSYVQTTGVYIVSGKADPDGVVTPWNYIFTVNPLAIKQNTAQSISSAILMITYLVLVFVFGGIGVRLFKSKNWWVLGLFFVFFASILLVYSAYLGYEYHRLFTGLPDSSFPSTIFYILLSIIVAGFLTSVGLLILQWKKVLRYVKKEIKRKEPSDEDLEDWDYDQWGGGNPWELPRVKGFK